MLNLELVKFEASKATEEVFICRGDIFNSASGLKKLFQDYCYLNAKRNHYVVQILIEGIKTLLLNDKILSVNLKLTNEREVSIWLKELY